MRNELAATIITPNQLGSESVTRAPRPLLAGLAMFVFVAGEGLAEGERAKLFSARGKPRWTARYGTVEEQIFGVFSEWETGAQLAREFLGLLAPPSTDTRHEKNKRAAPRQPDHTV
jgi:hypothetical protein